MEKHDARGHFALKKHFFKRVECVGGQVYRHFAFTEVAFTRNNSTTINVDAITT